MPLHHHNSGAFLSKFGLLSLAALVIGVTGCASPVPVARNFPISTQKVARTAHHWDVVAKDIVEQTSDALRNIEALKGRPVFVAERPATAFNVAFRDFMLNHLVDEGLVVNVCKPSERPGFSLDEAPVEVQYQTQLIQHGAHMPFYRPGLFTALATGVYVAHRIAHWNLDGAERDVLGIAGAAGLDVALGHLAFEPHTEIVVTTTIEQNNKYIMRRSDIYYVPDEDATLFFKRVTRNLSSCEGTQRTAGSPETRKYTTTDTPEQEQARWQMIQDNMRRQNPEWQAPSRNTSYVN